MFLLDIVISKIMISTLYISRDMFHDGKLL